MILACYISLRLGYTANHHAVAHLIPIGFYAAAWSLGPDLPQKAVIQQHLSWLVVGYGSQCRHEHELTSCWNWCMADLIPLFVFEFAVMEAICAVFWS